MKSDRLQYLFGQYFNQRASAAETEELMEMLDYKGNDEAVQKLLQENWETYTTAEEIFSKEQSEQIWNNLRINNTVRRKAPVFTFARMAAAAAVLLALGTGIYYFANKKNDATTSVGIAGIKNDVAPGGNKALLTLGDGSSIVLDSASNGRLVMQGNTAISKLNNGEITYNAEAGKEVLINTLSTPRGGHYKLTLPDGSIVWLNAASSLRYPTSFVGAKREVTVSGEAYFEIAKNAKQPFIVKVNDGSNIEVLGTHFNVMAYADEQATKTTLLQGAVKVNKGNASNILKPGQQAAVQKDGNINVLPHVNTEEVTAWKDDQFSFNSTDIHTVMKQVERWYDVDVAYNGTVTAHLNGNIKMNVPLSEVIKILEAAGNVKFAVNGKKITVSQE